MRTIYITLRALVCMLCVAGMFTACTEGNEWETDPSTAALFRVRNVQVDKAAAQTASVSWSATSSAEYYIIEVSTEQLSDELEMGTTQNSIIYGEDQSITSVPALISGLTKSSTYYLRVKSFGNGLESGWAYLDGTFDTTEEDILEKEFANGDITAESIRVKWNDAGLPVTHLSYEWQVSVGEDVTTQEATYELSSEEISAQSAVLSGLQPGTKYNISIYNNDDLRGITEATTEQIFDTPEVLGGNVTLKWNANGMDVTRLSYYPNDVEEAETTEYELTEADINASSITLAGLDLGKEYTFMIYNGEALRGITTATTEQIMNIATENIRGKSVTVTWIDNGTAATKLTYQPADGEETAWNEDLSAEGTDVTGLEGETEYTFRIYTDDVLRGEQTVTTLQGLIDVTIEAGITSATFTWAIDEAVVSYSCAKKGEDAQITEITEYNDNNENRTITVGNLTGGTEYTFTLYNADNVAVSNEQVFTTQADPLKGYTVIELTEASTKNDFINAINNNSGDIAILIGENANIDGTDISIIPASVNSLLIWGSDRTYTAYASGNKPKLKVSNWYVYGAKNKIEFFNLDIEANGTGSYVFQVREQNDSNMGNIEDIQFNSCNIANTAGLFSVRECKNTSNIICKSISYNDCIIHDVGNYSLAHVEASPNYYITNISIKNTTAYNVERCIIRMDSEYPSSNITIEQSTFYNCGAKNNTNYMLRLNHGSNPNINITNSLFGNVVTRCSLPSSYTFNTQNDYYTTDCTDQDNFFSTKATSTGNDAAALFPNATTGDFTVDIAELKAYGDPRWNK